MTLQQKCLNLAYKWLNERKIPQIKKGMVEELEQFVLQHLADEEVDKSVDKMFQKAETGDKNEQKDS